MNRIGQLVRSPVFEDIPYETVEALLERGLTLTFETGHRLFERGQDADVLMILFNGVVELYFPVEIMGVTHELTLETKQVGDVVAWSALVSPFQFALSARCATECELIGMNRDILHTYFETAPHAGYLFMRNLAGVIGRRLQAIQGIWTQELRTSAIKRLE